MSGPSPGASPQGRLLRKYVVVFVGLVGGVLMASSLVELYFAYQETKGAIVREERATAVATAAKIEEFARDIERRVRETTRAASDDPAAAQLGQGKLAFRGELGAALTEQRELDFLRLLRDVPAISELSHLDVVGQGAAPRLPARAGRGGKPGGFLAGAEVPRGEVGKDVLEPRVPPERRRALPDPRRASRAIRRRGHHGRDQPQGRSADDRPNPGRPGRLRLRRGLAGPPVRSPRHRPGPQEPGSLRPSTGAQRACRAPGRTGSPARSRHPSCPGRQ